MGANAPKYMEADNVGVHTPKQNERQHYRF